MKRPYLFSGIVGECNHCIYPYHSHNHTTITHACISVCVSCLFVDFGRQQTFSLYYFGCGMPQVFYQNPSMRKKRFFRLFGENLANSPGFPQVLTFTKFSPG